MMFELQTKHPSIVHVQKRKKGTKSITSFEQHSIICFTIFPQTCNPNASIGDEPLIFAAYSCLTCDNFILSRYFVAPPFPQICCGGPQPWRLSWQGSRHFHPHQQSSQARILRLASRGREQQ